MVLCIESKAALEEILLLGNLLNDRKIILVLPDEDKDTMSMGFKLFPRFVTWADSDFGDLGSVLKRMLELYDASNINSGCNVRDGTAGHLGRAAPY